MVVAFIPFPDHVHGRVHVLHFVVLTCADEIISAFRDGIEGREIEGNAVKRIFFEFVIVHVHFRKHVESLFLPRVQPYARTARNRGYRLSVAVGRTARIERGRNGVDRFEHGGRIGEIVILEVLGAGGRELFDIYVADGDPIEIVGNHAHLIIVVISRMDGNGLPARFAGYVLPAVRADAAALGAHERKLVTVVLVEVEVFHIEVRQIFERDPVRGILIEFKFVRGGVVRLCDGRFRFGARLDIDLAQLVNPAVADLPRLPELDIAALRFRP